MSLGDLSFRLEINNALSPYLTNTSRTKGTPIPHLFPLGKLHVDSLESGRNGPLPFAYRRDPIRDLVLHCAWSVTTGWLSGS